MRSTERIVDAVAEIALVEGADCDIDVSRVSRVTLRHCEECDCRSADRCASSPACTCCNHVDDDDDDETEAPPVTAIVITVTARGQSCVIAIVAE